MKHIKGQIKKNMENIKQIIKELELKLLDKNVRTNKNELVKIISEEYIEYGSSGRISSYSDVVNSLLNEKEKLNYKIIEMNIKILSENIILILYIIEMGEENNKIKSNRSSIWKKEEDNWKIIFHQGTKV